jgi:hypothetical protein
MPARARIAAAMVLGALAAPCPALARSGGAGAQPAARQQNATPQPTPDHQAPAPSATQPAATADTPARPPAGPEAPDRSLPDGVLPVAAGGLALLLAGLLLWRRPHAHR